MITCTIADGLATLVLDRPAAHNTIDSATAKSLAQAAGDLSHTDGLRAVLLRAEGPHFCPGGDLRSFDGRADVGRHLRDVAADLHLGIVRLAGLPVPVVSAVQGNAFGGGLSLALAADIVIVADDARFGTAYTAAGLSPDGGATWVLPRLVGLRRALELALTNRALTAQEAHAWGMVTTVVATADLAAASQRLASRLAEGPSQALGATKRLIWDGYSAPLAAQLELESLTMARIAQSPDARAGIAAFLAKAKPAFTGTG